MIIDTYYDKFWSIWTHLKTFVDIFNTNTVNSIIVIIVICLLHNNRMPKYQYRPSLVCIVKDVDVKNFKNNPSVYITSSVLVVVVSF